MNTFQMIDDHRHETKTYRAITLLEMTHPKREPVLVGIGTNVVEDGRFAYTAYTCTNRVVVDSNNELHLTMESQGVVLNRQEHFEALKTLGKVEDYGGFTWRVLDEDEAMSKLGALALRRKAG